MLTVWKRESIIPRRSLNTTSLSGWIEACAVKLQTSSSTDSVSIPVQSFGFIYASSSASLFYYLTAFLSTGMIQSIRSNRPLYTRGEVCPRRSSCISTLRRSASASRFHPVWPQLIFGLLSLMLAHTFAYPLWLSLFAL
jgi:hypothetical protein